MVAGRSVAEQSRADQVPHRRNGLHTHSAGAAPCLLLRRSSTAVNCILIHFLADIHVRPSRYIDYLHGIVLKHGIFPSRLAQPIEPDFAGPDQMQHANGDNAQLSSLSFNPFVRSLPLTVLRSPQNMHYTTNSVGDSLSLPSRGERVACRS